MDPNANLAEQAAILAKDTPDDFDKSTRQRLSELRRAMDEWLSKGGFQPDWKAYPAATKAYKTWGRRMAKFQDLWR